MTLAEITIELDSALVERSDDDDLEWILDTVVRQAADRLHEEISTLLEAKAGQVKVTT